VALAGVPHFRYGTGSDYAKGILGHDDIQKVGPELIIARPLLRNLIASRFPFIFVDESQDTNPGPVAALREITESAGNEICLGFFGDPMQKIYLAGAGPIALGQNWNEITKPENFRCPLSVLRVINRIRAADDGLQQVRGRIVERGGVIDAVEGSARLFILPADARRSDRLSEVRRWLAESNNDPLWESDSDVRVLVLVHSMAARRLGFADICTALYNGAPASLKAGFRDGSSWALRPLLTYILPLVLAARAGKDFDIFAMLRENCVLLGRERLVGQDVAELLKRLKADVDRLVEMLSEGSACPIRDVLTFVCDRELLILDDRIVRCLVGEASVDDGDEDGSEDAAVMAFLACPAAQLWGYRTYIEDESPFATQQGVKGAEFQRVLVILDDEESDYNLFSYGKYFGITPLSDTDRENLATGVDSVLGRTRRLFYVCCSRAMQDLAVVFFTEDLVLAQQKVRESALFEPHDIHTFPDVMPQPGNGVRMLALTAQGNPGANR
jgi:DNA helicase-2/ATP-dependent DNA helicase PcrA